MAMGMSQESAMFIWTPALWVFAPHSCPAIRPRITPGWNMSSAIAADWQAAMKIHKTVIRSFQVSTETTSGRVARLPERGRSTRNVRLS